ncbi:MAG TPA: hypothetical protein VKZ63_12625 [Kofleriaceae bacterium]|nr:hypothetical protein [Kofleriaceae bacterium]
MPIRWPAQLVCALAAAACASQSSPQECKDVCRREAVCVELEAERGPGAEEQNRFDQSECVAACTALQRDPRGKELVARHVECAAKAGDDCEALLACD